MVARCGSLFFIYFLLTETVYLTNTEVLAKIIYIIINILCVLISHIHKVLLKKNFFYLIVW